MLSCALLLAACQANSVQVAPAQVAAIQPTAAMPAATGQETVAPVGPPTATLIPASPTPAGTPTDTPAPTHTPLPTLRLRRRRPPAPKSLKETENILVLGMDQRPGELGWRTDTIIVVAIDYDAKQVGMVSIPRDLWVNIPGYGMGRINQVDFQGEAEVPGGGPALVAKVILDTLGIPTQHWVRLQAGGVARVGGCAGRRHGDTGLPPARADAGSEGPG